MNPVSPQPPSTKPVVIPALAMPLAPEIEQRVQNEAVYGWTFGATWKQMHPEATLEQFSQEVARNAAKLRPADDKPELALLHKLADGRTDELNTQAIWVDRNGLWGGWNTFAADYRAHAGKQAEEGLALLGQAQDATTTVTFAMKDSVGRDRPFRVDPTLTVSPGVGVSKSGAFPSGHASNAWASALVLSKLWPERSAEFLAHAQQLGAGRMYAGVHFPSDVASGAYVGAAMAAFALTK
jgi:hypothetical protein